MEYERKKIVFESDNLVFQTTERPKSVSGMVGLVKKISGGIIKDEKQANLVLITVAIVAFIAAIAITMNATSSPSLPSPDEIIEIAG